ncbi:MAG: BON domain-containing protein [Planctomycetales bacterium]|nr:BON domain-containing protein [Planctomycetales bacterium]
MASEEAQGRNQTPQMRNVLEQAQTALEHSPIRVLRDIRVDNQGDSIVLFGRVASFYQKQLAQELVRGVIQDHELQNAISVES